MEEGEFIRCQIHVPSTVPPNGVGVFAIQLENEIEIKTPDVIRKLAPSCPIGSRALMVSVSGERLIAYGILELRWNLSIVPFGSYSISTAPRLNGTTIVILGPGRIQVCDCFRAVELRAGKIVSPLARFVDYAPISEAFKPIIQNVFSNRARFTDTFPDENDPTTHIHYLVADTWQKLIRLTIDAKRGGASVISTPNSLNQIKIKYPLVPLPLGQRMVNFWEKYFWIPIESEIVLQKLYEWRDAYSELYEGVNSAVAMSRVDGSVVLDQNLRFLGFGAKLTPRIDAVNEMIKCIDPWTNLPDPQLESRVSLLGTRHSSAFNFCRANPDTMAFVVSQDGDVRIFLV